MEFIDESTVRDFSLRTPPRLLEHTRSETSRNWNDDTVKLPQYMQILRSSPASSPSRQPSAESPLQMGINHSSCGDDTIRPSTPRSSSIENTAALLRRFNEYKLETEFYNGYVVHKTYEWAPSSSDRVWKTSTWKRKGKIGSGGFGSVWLQEGEGEGENKQLRAVKILHRDPSEEMGRSQELLALVKLKGYEHLFVDFLGWYEDLDYIYLAMEYIKYGDLSNYIKAPGPKAEVKEITKQVLEGLEVLHGKKIYHRDLTPQNILIASLEPIWVKIADFGASKQAKKTSIRTQVGTQGYLAPELLGFQVLPREFRRRRYVPHALDMWSLGSLVHKLLTSETPFMYSFEGSDSESGYTTELPQVETDMDSLQKYCHGSLEFPMEPFQKAQIDEEGVSFVKSLLAANPNNRPTASQALKNPWLIPYASGFVKSLITEFLLLGVDLSLMANGISIEDCGVDIVRYFPDSAKRRFLPLLQEAATEGYNTAFAKLLESPSCRLGSIDGSTRGKLFQLATEARQLDTIELLLEKRFEIGACIGDETVLQWAVRTGHVSPVTLLLKNFPNVETNKDCKEAFLLAVELENFDMVNSFLSNDIKFDGRGGAGIEALKVAVKSGNIKIVKLLLGNRDPSTKVQALRVAGGGGDSGIFRLLQAACENGHIGIVRLLLENKADVNAKEGGNNGRTVLQVASGSGHVVIVKFLLENKADVNADPCDFSGRTALQAAAGGGHMDIVKLLLENKADVNDDPCYYSGRTALQAAAEGGHMDIVKLLLENKADVNASLSDYNGRTALQAAAGGGHMDIVKLLLENKADVNADSSGRTALQAAAEGGHMDIVKFLLENKADVNADPSRFYGQTALQAATRGGHMEIVKLLLENKAGATVAP